MLQARPRTLSIDEFIRDYAGLNEKYELIDGEARAMAGASKHHNRISGNIYVGLRVKLRGSGCEPFGSDARLMLDAGNIRFPDVAIYCDARDIGLGDQETMSFPKVVFEVLSPSTKRFDLVHKLLEYKKIDSVDTIVLVDGGNRTLDVYERVGPLQWNNFAVIGGTLKVRNPAVELSFDEIFLDVDSDDEGDSRG